MVTDDDKIIIERLLDGSLPDNDHRILRARLESDGALNDYLEQQREMQSWITREARVVTATNYLRGLEDGAPAKEENAEKTVAARKRYPLLIGAFLLLLLLLGAYWFYTRATAPEPIIDHRPLAVAMADAPPPGVAAYNAQKFADALPLLIAGEAANPNPEYQLAIVVSYLETGRPEAALPYLDLLAEAPLYSDAHTFYRALTLWQLGRSREATSALNQLPSDSYYAPAAGRLRARLKN